MRICPSILSNPLMIFLWTTVVCNTLHYRNWSFIFPSAAPAANCHQLPENETKAWVTMINGLTLLRSLGVQAFNIDPRRWHKIKTYLSQGTIEYPQMSEDGKVIIDGRHRILLIMQIYKVTDVPRFFLKGIS